MKNQNLSNLNPDERVKALRKYKTASTRQNRDKVLALPGSTGNTFTPPVQKIGDSRPPKGWEPGVTFGKDGKPATICSPALPSDLEDEKALKKTLELLDAMVPQGYWARLAEMRLDTGAWTRSAQGEDATTKPLRRYRWVIEPLPEEAEVIGGMSEADWNAAITRISKRRFPQPKIISSDNAVDLVVPHGDLQAGQHDGDSVEGLIARMTLYPIIVKAEINRLRKSGTQVKRLVLPSLGDLIENIIGFYANQTWVVRLNLRQQRTLARRLITAMIEELATLGLPILVPVVPGNHGENRNSKGKVFTDISDNSDLEVMETVAEIIRANERLAEMIEFHFPEGENQTLTLDLGYGYGVAFHHGHLQGHGSGHAAAKATAYLKSQALAEMPIGRAKYIITGHFHSAMYVTMPGNKTWIQIPALCDASQHFSEMFGLTGGPGLLTFTLGPNGLSNWMHHRAPTVETVDDELAAAEEEAAQAKRSNLRSVA